MKSVLIIGAGRGGTSLINIIQETKSLKIVAVIDKKDDAPGILLARRLHIPTDNNWTRWLHNDLDIIIETTGDDTVLNSILKQKNERTIVIPGSVAYIIYELFAEKEALLDKLTLQMKNQELMMKHIRDGMIIVDRNGIVQFVNESATDIIGCPKEQFIGQHIKKIIKNSRLTNVLESHKKEINQKFVLENGKQIVTTRIPVINQENELIGAIAVFKDITEVIKLAEENTDLTEIKTMLEAIIMSSNEAISVVDENGNGLMINPAYTRITGLTEKDVIGKPATADISEGESMHFKVLQTKKTFRGVRMKVGPKRKDVVVNVAPVIVNGKVKGSVGVIHDVSEIKALTAELQRARQIIRNLQAKYTFDDIIGNSPQMKLALDQAKIGAKTPATVLLRGDSGTGKELFAHAIHNESDRKNNKFIRVNCAAIAESILESELFGYEEGAFSGAKHGGKKGLFEEANLGSIFLDEIGELSLSMQAKLLRVLQENEIVRVGGTKPISIDVRIIAATNVNLEKAIENHSFRKDLYYRLTRLPIYIPPLKERMEDLPLLVNHIILKINQDYGRNVRGISDDALHVLKQYDWPGNVRELENIIGRTMIYMDMNEEIIQREHIPNLEISQNGHSAAMLQTREARSLKEATEQFERDYIQMMYLKHGRNKTQTAKALNISIRNLYYKLEKYHLV